jgi:hypothetical protein
LESYEYGDIVDEVLRLKSIFNKSFNVAMVDRLVEDIIAGKKEECHVFETNADEIPAIKQELKGLASFGAKESVKIAEQAEREEEEEVWDWRRAYDKRGKARKR